MTLIWYKDRINRRRKKPTQTMNPACKLSHRVSDVLVLLPKEMVEDSSGRDEAVVEDDGLVSLDAGKTENAQRT